MDYDRRSASPQKIFIPHLDCNQLLNDNYVTQNRDRMFPSRKPIYSALLPLVRRDRIPRYSSLLFCSALAKHFLAHLVTWPSAVALSEDKLYVPDVRREDFWRYSLNDADSASGGSIDRRKARPESCQTKHFTFNN